MDDKELASFKARIAIKQKLKDEFAHYATRCLKIRAKTGEIKPFELNKAQLYTHAKLEEQKGRTGKVRALVLKGRQQGMCLSPDTKILTAKYQWKRIDQIKVGDELIGCDEYGIGTTSIGRQCARKLRTSIVEAKAILTAPVFKVILDNGAELKLTANHRMLCRQRGGDCADWREAKYFKVGDSVRVVARMPNYKSSFMDGWIGGIIDGEGSWRGNKGPKRLSIHQCDGDVLQNIKKYLNSLDIPFCEVLDKRTSGLSSKLGDKPVHRIDLHRLPYIWEILSRCKPLRFLKKDWHSGVELPGKSAQNGIKPWTSIVSIEEIGEQEVIDLQTTTKTFIANGLVSHNSTYIGGRFYHRVTWNKGQQAFILTHALDATNNLYQMAKRYYEHTPDAIKLPVSKSNAKELIFGCLEGGYKLGTAENKKVGRSSTIQLLHGSECAFWNNAADHATGIMQAVPNAPGTEIILESTANGVGNYFHQMWQDAEAGISEFIAIFVPWFWQDEYAIETQDFVATPDEQLLAESYSLTDGQLAWRRRKIIELSVNGMDGERAFKQEYPCNAVEAFQLTGEDNYIASDIVLSARKTVDVERIGPKLLGVDPARMGDDRTAIIRRQGRVAYKLETHTKLDTMQVTGLVKTIIEAEVPDKVFIDIGAMGAGVYDRLRELVDPALLVAVNFGGSPYDGQKYKNKKAEMWGLMREWLNEFPCSIPDSDELHADLTGVKYQIDSNSRLILESKEHMKKRGIRSCDTSDALALTFAMPDSAIHASIRKQQAQVLQSLGDSMAKRRQLLESSRFKGFK